MKYKEITHLSHPHILVLESAEEPYQCDGCKEVGFGPCFKCEQCNFNLHEECAMPEPSAFHPFFRKCNFRFYENAPGYRARYCDACGKDVRGFVYQCLHEKAHDLHPCCMKLQRTLIGDGVKLHLSDKVSTRCLKCGSKEISKGFRGWSYESSCGQYCYHVACVKNLVLENWRMGYFDHGHNMMALQIMAPNEDNIVQQTGGSSSGRRKASKYWRMAKVALTLIISAIFGDPTTVVATLIASLLSS
jgi:hypothetical protein